MCPAAYTRPATATHLEKLENNPKSTTYLLKTLSDLHKSTRLHPSGFLGLNSVNISTSSMLAKCFSCNIHLHFAKLCIYCPFLCPYKPKHTPSITAEAMQFGESNKSPFHTAALQPTTKRGGDIHRHVRQAVPILAQKLSRYSRKIRP